MRLKFGAHCSLALVLLALAIGINAQAAPHVVRLADIRQESVSYRVRTYGVLLPNVEDISFQIPGRIERFLVDEGDRVEAGQLLVELDIQDARDILRQRELDLKNAQRSLDRMKTLHADGSIQESRLDDVQAQYDQVKIAFEQAELHLARCQLKAPSAGVILKQFIESRTSIGPGQPIFVFQSDDVPWITKVDLTDRNALRMAEGAIADVRFAPYPGEAFTGQVTKLAQVANPEDGLYTAEVTISAMGRELRPGMVAEVDLIKVSSQQYSIIPFDALLNVRRTYGLIYLLSPDRQHAIEQSVTIHNIDGDQVAVTEDLSAFRQVVVGGHYGLEDNAPISVLGD